VGREHDYRIKIVVESKKGEADVKELGKAFESLERKVNKLNALLRQTQVAPAKATVAQTKKLIKAERERADAFHSRVDAEREAHRQFLLDSRQRIRLEGIERRELEQLAGKRLEAMSPKEFQRARREAQATTKTLEEIYKRRAALLRIGLTQEQFEKKSGFRMMALGAGRFRYELAKLDPRVQRLNASLGGWWKRFGQVALGFTIAYRAMNLFEAGLRKVTELIRESIALSGTLGSMQAKITVFASLYKLTGGRTFIEELRAARGYVQDFARTAIWATTPMADLQEGFTELMKWGQLVPRRLVPAYTTFFDFIAQVAATNKDYARQIRSELRGLMTGTKRAGNVMVFIVERMFGPKVTKRIKSMVDAGESLNKVVVAIAEAWHKVQLEMAKADPAKAMIVWTDQIKFSFVKAIDAVSLTIGKGDQNVFARPLLEAADRWPKIFEQHKDLFASLFNTLANGERLLIRMFEKTLLFAARVNSALIKIKEPLIALGKAALLVFGIMSAKLFAGWMLKPFIGLSKIVWSVAASFGGLLLKTSPLVKVWGFLVSKGKALVIVLRAMTLGSIIAGVKKLALGFKALTAANIISGIRTLTNSILLQVAAVVALGTALQALVRWVKENRAALAERFEYVPGTLPGALHPGAEWAKEKPKAPLTNIWETYKETLEIDAKAVLKPFKAVMKEIDDFFNKPPKKWKWEEALGTDIGKKGPPSLEALKTAIKDLKTSWEGLYNTAISSGKYMEASRIFPFVERETVMKIKALEKELKTLDAVLKKVPEAKGTAEEKKLFEERIKLRKAFLVEQIRLSREHLKALGWETQRAYIPIISDMQSELDKRVEALRERFQDSPEAFYNAVLALANHYRNLLPTIVNDPELQKAISGFVEHMDQMVEGAKKSINTLRDTVSELAQNMERSMSDYFFNVMTGKFKSFGKALVGFFDSISRSIQRMLADMMAQMVVTNWLKPKLLGLLGLHAEGGILPGKFTPIKRFTEGGVVSSPTLGMVGEGGYPEAIIPLKEGFVPVKQLGEQKGTVNINIQALDARSFNEWLSRGGWEAIRAHMYSEYRNAGPMFSMVRGG